MLSEGIFDEHFQPASFAEYFQLGSWRNIRPIKNGLYGQPVQFFHDGYNIYEHLIFCKITDR